MSAARTRNYESERICRCMHLNAFTLLCRKGVEWPDTRAISTAVVDVFTFHSRWVPRMNIQSRISLFEPISIIMSYVQIGFASHDKTTLTLLPLYEGHRIFLL